MRVSNLAERAVYGVITPEIIGKVCQTRKVYADLLSHSSDPETRHAAFMVRETVIAIEAELMELIS